MAVQTSAGITLAISAALPATNDAAGFEALTDFETVGEIESIGEYGIVYNPITFTALGDRRVRKFKGSYDPGEPGIALAIDRDDTGQLLARTALADDADYSFKVTFQDGDIDYYQGKVMSFTTNPSSVDDILMGNMNIGINSDPVAVPFVAGP